MNLRNFRSFLASYITKNSKSIEKYNLEKLSSRLNYTFHDTSILLQALKHRSFLTITDEPRIQSNERLELLGDSVLGMIVTEYLYMNYPNYEEGELTSLKSMLVSRNSLSQIGKDFGLGEFILLSESESNAGGRQRASILSDCVEAIIGAIYLDGGIDQARNFVKSNIVNHLKQFLSDGKMRNYKSILLEYCQSTNIDGPVYVVEKEEGPDHNKVFYIAAYLNNEKHGFGKGRTKKIAEQRAAKESLRQLKLI